MESTVVSAVPLGHATLRLADLLPSKNPAFSPNFHRWLRDNAHFYTDGGIAESVFRVKSGTKAARIYGEGALMIGFAINGYPGDTDFSGALLISTLCNGAGAGRGCHGGMVPGLELVQGFWDRYLAVGRCAIDPGHQEYFSGAERFQGDGDTRTCLWCGQTQRRVLTPRTVVDESWV